MKLRERASEFAKPCKQCYSNDVRETPGGFQFICSGCGSSTQFADKEELEWCINRMEAKILGLQEFERENHLHKMIHAIQIDARKSIQPYADELMKIYERRPATTISVLVASEALDHLGVIDKVKADVIKAVENINK